MNLFNIEVIRAGNFRMVNIKIYAWSSLLLNLKTNLILYLYPEKCIKIQPIRVAYMKPINLKFCAPFKINIQKREGLSYLKKPVFDSFLLYSRKNGLRRKSIACPLETLIK